MTVVGALLPEIIQEKILEIFDWRPTFESPRFEVDDSLSGPLMNDQQWLEVRSFEVDYYLLLKKPYWARYLAHNVLHVPLQARLVGLRDRTPPLIVADALEDVGHCDLASLVRRLIR